MKFTGSDKNLVKNPVCEDISCQGSARNPDLHSSGSTKFTDSSTGFVKMRLSRHLNALILVAIALSFTHLSCMFHKKTLDRSVIESIRSDAGRNTQKMDEPRPAETKSEKESLQKQEPEKSISQDTSEIVKKGDVWRDGEWIVAFAECTEFILSREEAVNKATNEARMKAVAFEAGIVLISDTTIDQNEQRVLFDKYTNIKSRGKIIDEDGDPVIEIISTDMKDSRGLPVYIYRVTVRCKVVQEGEHDPLFSVTLGMDKAIYNTGETMKFMVKSTQDCYITIFNVHGNDNKVHMLFPNDYDSDNFIFANTVTTIPSANSGIVFKAMLDEKQNRSSELIQVVATKKKVNFAEGWSKEAIFSFYPTPASAGYTIGKILVNMPCEQWTETAKTLIIEQNNPH